MIYENICTVLNLNRCLLHWDQFMHNILNKDQRLQKMFTFWFGSYQNNPFVQRTLDEDLLYPLIYVSLPSEKFWSQNKRWELGRKIDGRAWGVSLLDLRFRRCEGSTLENVWLTNSDPKSWKQARTNAKRPSRS